MLKHATVGVDLFHFRHCSELSLPAAVIGITESWTGWRGNASESR
jgi:hypothetical protein